MEVGDTITYSNATGDKLHLIVSEKEFSKFGIVYDSKQECVNDNSQTIGYCYDIEFALLYLKSVNNDLDFIIGLDIAPITSQPIIDEIGDRIFIMTNDGPGYIFMLEAIVNQRTLPSDATIYQNFDESIELLGVDYQNVYSSSSNSTYKILLYQRNGYDWICRYAR